MHGIPWQVIQQIVAVIPDLDTDDQSSKKDSNEPMEFFEFGKKLMG